MVGLQPTNITEERESILSLLDENRNVEQFIHQNLHRQENCFIVDKEFWDSWTDNISLKSNRSSFDSRSEIKNTIDNLSLIEEGH